MKQLKPLKDLTLLDKFLFDETMDHPEAHQALLQIILGREDLMMLSSGAVCLMLVLYWLCYLVLKRKY